jgi:hypothetical protein
MAGYIVQIQVGSTPCPKGQQHITRVSLSNGHNWLKDVSIAEALMMQQDGDSLVIGLPSGWQARANFVTCPCGQGYLLEQGPTAADLARQP